MGIQEPQIGMPIIAECFSILPGPTRPTFLWPGGSTATYIIITQKLLLIVTAQPLAQAYC